MQNAKFKLRIANCRKAEAGGTDALPQSPAPSPQPRAGLTLIELLIVITIISMLTALVIGVATVAGETSREQHTKHVVERLHTLLMDYYGTLKTRRVRLRESDPSTTNGIEAQISVKYPNDAKKQGQAVKEARLYAMREMLLLEVPDRWSDVLLSDVGPSSGPPSTTALAPLYLAGRTDLSNVYLRRYLGLVGRTNTLTGNPNTAEEIKRNQGAECLYMIITTACGDGEARTLFGESTIGDSDGDGAPEFVDGWGHPVNFIRWPSGFDSQIQLNANQLGSTWSKAAAGDHEPFDLFRQDALAFRLVPLIFSPGRDEDSGLNVAPDFVTWRRTTQPTITLNTNSPFITAPILSPYKKGSPDYPDDYYGTQTDTTATDNVHNHLLGER
jgi:prepilin-type N-terminal cleavage/methylation domain-containing protein